VALSLPVVWSEDHRLHQPGGEVWIGVRVPGDEVPERADAIRAALEGAGAPVVEAVPHPDGPLLAVHDAGLVDFLRGAWEGWEEAGYVEDPGQDRVVAYIFPHLGLMDRLTPAVPAAASARAGMFAFDTMTPVGPGTWTAARAAVDAALTACDLVLGGAHAAYACTRPPGHHATRSAYGGSCYLNNAAAAAQYLRDGGVGRVALVDLDAHHGNGAQAIFWTRRDVFTASVHVDPGAGWFPHFLGFAHERGGGTGEGANVNLPLEAGTGDDGWLTAVDAAIEAVGRAGAEALVLALGVDAAASDPESPLEVTEGGYRAAGRRLGALQLPTVVVQEGGYDLATIGELVLAALTGLEEGREKIGA
jgi:acetoin utilization deacetylase AcuC-like enzyme